MALCTRLWQDERPGCRKCVSSCHSVVYKAMAGRCPEYRKCVSSCHRVVYRPMAGAAVWVPRIQYTKKNVHMKAKEILRNFKTFRDILREFQKRIKESLPALTLKSRPVTTTQRYWGLKIINIRMHFEMILTRFLVWKSSIFACISRWF